VHGYGHARQRCCIVEVHHISAHTHSLVMDTTLDSVHIQVLACSKYQATGIRDEVMFESNINEPMAELLLPKVMARSYTLCHEQKPSPCLSAHT